MPLNQTKPNFPVGETSVDYFWLFRNFNILSLHPSLSLYIYINSWQERHTMLSHRAPELEPHNSMQSYIQHLHLFKWVLTLPLWIQSTYPKLHQPDDIQYGQTYSSKLSTYIQTDVNMNSMCWLLLKVLV